MKLRSIAPIRAYHVTTVDIPRFDARFINDIGFHFAQNVEQCLDHVGIMDMEDPILVTVDLYIENPATTNDACYWDEIRNLHNIRTNDQRVNELIPTIQEPRQLVDILTKFGYDSIRYDNEYEASGIAYIVWDTKQIAILNKQSIHIDDETGEIELSE